MPPAAWHHASVHPRTSLQTSRTKGDLNIWVKAGKVILVALARLRNEPTQFALQSIPVIFETFQDFFQFFTHFSSKSWVLTAGSHNMISGGMLHLRCPRPAYLVKLFKTSSNSASVMVVGGILGSTPRADTWASMSALTFSATQGAAQGTDTDSRPLY